MIKNLLLLFIFTPSIISLFAQKTEIIEDFRIDSTIVLEYEDGIEIKDYRKDYTYKENGITNTVTRSEGDKETGEWVYDERSYHNLAPEEFDARRFWEKWNKETQQWENDREYGQYLTSAGREYYFISHYWNNETEKWEQRSKAEFDSITRSCEWQKWNVDLMAWENDHKYENTLDEDGNIIHYESQKWDVELQEWYFKQMKEYLYDTEGNKIRTETRKWDRDLKEWNLYSLDTSSFDINGNNVKTIHYSYNKDLLEYKPRQMVLKEYNQDNEETVHAVYNWNDELPTPDWEFSFMNKKHFNGNGDLFRYEGYNNGEDELSWYAKYEYDSEGRQVKSTTYIHVEEQEKMVVSRVSESYYSLHQFVVEVEEDEEIEIEGGVAVTETNIEMLEEVSITLAPVPAKEFITVIGDNVSDVTIKTLSGQLLIAVDSNQNVDISSLSKGVYVLHCKSGSHMVSKIFIKN